MIRNYFIVSLRNILRQKLFAFINITGLSIGIAAAIILYLFADYELSYDQFHQNTDQIHLVYKNRITPAGTQATYDTWLPLLQRMQAEFSEVVDGTRIYERNVVVEINGTRFNEQSYFVDPSYFSVFDFPVARGDAHPLHDPFSVVISSRMAAKFFGNTDPIGKVIRINFQQDYTVTGVLRDYPQNAFFASELVFPLNSLEDYTTSAQDWNSSFLYTFVMLRKDADPAQLTAKFPSFVKNVWNEDVQRRTQLELLPLRASYETFVGQKSDVYILVVVGIVLVIIVSINFVNLSSARSLDRSKEVSMRKVFGAHRSQLIKQFLSESILMSLTALICALFLVYLSLTFINTKFSLHLALNLDSPLTYLTLISFALLLGLVAGLFPALVLSGMGIQRAIKSFEGDKAKLRYILVGVQFTLAMILMVTLMVIGKQVNFMKGADMGFSAHHKIVIPISVQDFAQADEAVVRLQSFKDIISKYSGVKSITSSRHIPTVWTESNTFISPEGWQDAPLRMRYTYHDADFLKTYDISLIEGDGFMPDAQGDQRESVIINEAALRAFGWTDIKDKYLMMGTNRIRVVGLIKNFNFETLRKEVAPVLHFHRVASNRTHQYITLDVAPGSARGIIDYVQSKWNILDASHQLPFNYFFLDQNIGRMYQAEDRLFSMITIFSITILIVACMGLFGLSTFTVEKKKKEIGIRKVLGASVGIIVLQFFKKYLTLMVISFAVAFPLTWYLMQRWLEGYATHIDMSISPFIFSFALIVPLALGAISTRILQVAMENPSRIIREQ